MIGGSSVVFTQQNSSHSIVSGTYCIKNQVIPACAGMTLKPGRILACAGMTLKLEKIPAGAGMTPGHGRVLAGAGMTLEPGRIPVCACICTEHLF